MPRRSRSVEVLVPVGYHADRSAAKIGGETTRSGRLDRLVSQHSETETGGSKAGRKAQLHPVDFTSLALRAVCMHRLRSSHSTGQSKSLRMCHLGTACRLLANISFQCFTSVVAPLAAWLLPALGPVLHLHRAALRPEHQLTDLVVPTQPVVVHDCAIAARRYTSGRVTSPQSVTSFPVARRCPALR